MVVDGRQMSLVAGGVWGGVVGSFGDRLRGVSGTGYKTPKLAQLWLPLSSFTIGAGSWVEPIEIHNYGVYTQEDT
jgi:hypothetical protein